MNKAWVIGSFVTPSFLGMLNRTVTLMREKGCETDAILTDMNLERKRAGVVKAAGAHNIWQLPLDIRDINCEEQAVLSLKDFYQIEKPNYIIFESSIFFSSVAPAFAAAVDCGITADCTELAWHEDGSLLQIRPAFGGRKLASNITVKGTAIATVRKGVFHLKPVEYCSDSEFRILPVCKSNHSWNLTVSIIREAAVQDLQDASVIVSGGLGMGSRKNYERLYELAELVGAAVAASRAAVAAGFAGYDRQVGQTGVSVRPELYITFGISGAVQHLSGITGAKKIIAVNSDPRAPIHQYSDLSVIADCNQTIDRLIDKLKNG